MYLFLFPTAENGKSYVTAPIVECISCQPNVYSTSVFVTFQNFFCKFRCFILFKSTNRSFFKSLLNSVGGVGAWVAWVAWVRGFVGGVNQILASVAWVAWVAWVHKILAWVVWVEILAWLEWVSFVKKILKVSQNLHESTIAEVSC